MGYVVWHRSAIIADMSDTTENPKAAQPVATAATEEALPVATAATALGITSDAIRARIRRGAMRGEKRGGAWFVYVPVDERRDTKPDSDATRVTPKHDENPTEPDTLENVTTPDATENPTVATSVVDLAPLADLIERQAKELADLREAATIWQIRARQAEEQLKALTAGTSEPETTPEIIRFDPYAPQETPQLLQASEPAPTGIAAWFRRLWGG